MFVKKIDFVLFSEQRMYCLLMKLQKEKKSFFDMISANYNTFHKMVY